MTEQSNPNPFADKDPEFAYHILQHSLNLSEKHFSALSEEEKDKVIAAAEESWSLEQKVLSSEMAESATGEPQQLDSLYESVTSRYEEESEMERDLSANFLSKSALRSALSRALKFHNVMQKAMAGKTEVTDEEAKEFYETNKDQLGMPEKRVARHILITTSEGDPEGAAHAKAEQALEGLAGDPQSNFETIAMKYSECPSAAQGGKLGDLPQGKLYPELDQVLFSMNEGDLSGLVDSEAGTHILWCEQIIPPQAPNWEMAEESIRKHLTRQKEIGAQKEFISSL